MDMNDNDRQRAALGRLVSRLSTSDSDFAKHLQIRDDAGRRVVVPILDTDSVFLAMRLVHQSGGRGMLAILDTERQVKGTTHLVMAALNISATSGTQGQNDLPVVPGCTLADLIKVLQPGTTVTLKATGRYEAVEVEEMGMADVPADAALNFACR